MSNLIIKITSSAVIKRQIKVDNNQNVMYYGYCTTTPRKSMSQ